MAERVHLRNPKTYVLESKNWVLRGTPEDDLQLGPRSYELITTKCSVNNVYRIVNLVAQSTLTLCFIYNMPSDASADATSNLHAIRRANLLALLQTFCEKQLATGVPAKGLELAFAEQLQVSKSLFSQLKSSRNISDAMAMQIEKRCSAARGWLSMERQPAAHSRVLAGEERFLELARVAYRSQSVEGRKALRVFLEGVISNK
jgi:hypothetical protein